MTRVLIQAGHSQRFPPYLPGGGGAPGEANWTSDLAELLKARLDRAGVMTVLVGAWLVNDVQVPPPPEAEDDYDLFVSCHYDAAIYALNTGCLAGRATLDPMGAEADRFLARWCVGYPAATGIPLHQERLNPNITNYYAFRDTSDQTPGVLLEHGVGMGLDHDTLYNDIDLIAEVDARIMLAHLGVTQPEDDDMAKLTADQQAILAKMAALNANSTSIDSWLSALGEYENNTIPALRDEVAQLTDRLSNAQLLTDKSIMSVAVTRKSGAVEVID